MKTSRPFPGKAGETQTLGNNCFPVPPHPSLKKEMDNFMTDLKKKQKSNFLFSKLTFNENLRTGLDDGLIYPGVFFPLGTSMTRARTARSQQPPLRGIVNVLVVLVDFDDQPMNTPINRYEDLFFSEKKVETGSVREYYQEVSNGKIQIQGDVVGPYRLPKTLATYANNSSGTGQNAPNARTMALDTAMSLLSGINLTVYDNDRDGFVDAFVIVHAGTGGEVTNDPNKIWSHKWVLDGKEAYTPAGNTTKLYSYLTVPEDCLLGVCAHELGHLLFGFPDLYDSTYQSEGIGSWCLMSGGSWNNNGNTPAHPSAWCKANQGWITVDVPKTNQTNVSIADVKTGFTVKKLWKNGIPGNEYFLLENRQQDKFDLFLPGNGLLIWHIDEATEANTNPRHYKVALIQADGKSDLEKNRNSGDNEDPYPGGGNKTRFSKTTKPSSLSYGGLDTMVQVSNIRTDGPDIVCDISIA